MTTILCTHDACIKHETGHWHPERPDRLRAVLAALEAEEFQLLQRIEAPRASEEQLRRVHAAPHIEQVRASIPARGALHHFDPDTAVGSDSLDAILRAAGGVAATIDAVMKGEGRNGFCAVRPPGHHAERDQAMGFCLFNNIAIGAMHLRVAHGLERIAVVDFDVHHGNGTQDIFYNDGGLFYASTHQWPAYPGTGLARETGCSDNIVNLPLPPGTGSRAWREAVREALLPRLRAFRPEFVLVSAGFDAHRADPLAQMELATADFHWVTKELCDIAEEFCANRLVSALEGGYDLDALGQSAAAHVRALMEA